MAGIVIEAVNLAGKMLTPQSVEFIFAWADYGCLATLCSITWVVLTHSPFSL